MNYKLEKNKITIFDTSDFNIEHILECGQVFRYKKLENCYEVYSLNHKATIFSQKVVTICCDDEKYFEKYFDLERDYAKIKVALKKDSLIGNSIDFGYGIRILNQSKLEAIISFIISANNNIPRIKQIIENICTNYGEYVAEQNFYAFPTFDKLCNIPLEFFTKIKCGYRDKYLYNTIQMLKNVDLKEWETLSSEKLKQELLKLYGVGSKVADCIMLYGFHRSDVFPTDTWIKKVYVDFCAGDDKATEKKVRSYFVNRYKELSGYAQQYLFYNKRSSKWEKEKLHY